MGKLETQSKRLSRRRELQKMILGAVAVAGLIGVALVAPNVIGAMGKLGMLPTKRQRETVSRSRDRLIERGLLHYDGKFLRLTPQGERELRRLETADFKLKKPRRWDGKWRVLIFDIREERKTLREKVRRTLSTIGFVRLQDSVWIYPYDCEDLITFLKADFKIGKDILYMIVESLEYDKNLRSLFGLTLQ